MKIQDSEGVIWLESLHDSMRRYDTAFTRMLKRWKLFTNSFRVLYVLLGNPDGVEPAAIADQVNLVRPAVTAILNLLESRGLIERREHEADRRKKLILLTSSGRKLAEEVCSRCLNEEREAAEKFGSAAMKEFSEMFDRYSRALYAQVCGVESDMQPIRSADMKGKK